MISITVYQNSNGNYIKFDTEGHAEYAEEGQDIVCASVSVLVINTINSIEQLTDCNFDSELQQETGMIHFNLHDSSYESDLFLRSMILGLEAIQEEYGQDLIQLIYKEV